MKSDTHVAGAMALQSGILWANSIQNKELIVGSLFIAAGGALIPDFDHAGSYISNRYPLLGWVGLLFQHRGFTHTLAFWGLLYALLPYGYEFGIENGWWTSVKWAHTAIAVFVMGGISHILLDFMTPSGVPWLGPLSWDRYSLDLLSTGSFLEYILELLFFGMIFFFLSILFGSSPQNLIENMIS